MKNDPNVERVEEDNPMCVDILKPDNETETDNGRNRRSFEPDEICWNIDRLDERSLPLDGDYCPPVQGKYVTTSAQCVAMLSDCAKKCICLLSGRKWC